MGSIADEGEKVVVVSLWFVMCCNSTFEKMKNLVVLTGAGISAESGIRTFRDMGGLWEEYDIEEVASPQGWENNKELVLDFYNQRRKQLKRQLKTISIYLLPSQIYFLKHL